MMLYNKRHLQLCNLSQNNKIIANYLLPIRNNNKKNKIIFKTRILEILIQKILRKK